MNHKLTRREWQVLRLLARRMSNKQIAKHLHLSLHTIKNHVHNILEKLHVSDREEAVHVGLGIKLNNKTCCDVCPIAAKAVVVADGLKKLAEELKG